MAKALRQYAALVYRISDSGAVEVLLVTSRDTRQWILPKGNPIRGLKPYNVAKREIFEEAGIVGRVTSKPLGSFAYNKCDGAAITPCRVHVFAVKFERQLKKWKEQGQREVMWATPEQALTLLLQNTNIPKTGRAEISTFYEKEMARMAALRPKKKKRAVYPKVPEAS